MATTITYADKSKAQDSGFPDNQTFTATNANQIKSVVNDHADDIDDLESSVASLQSDMADQQTGDAYVPQGWAYYRDSETSPATISITTTPTLLTIDGGGGTSENGHLPLAIRGSGELWASNKITPIGAGDAYDIRLDLEISAKTGSPNYIDLELDIGGGVSPSTVVVTRSINAGKTTPFDISIGFPIFCLSTFLTNGGQIFLSTDTGTVTVAGRGIMIKRDYSGALT